ncbi:Uncharacterised protein [Chryseobacterium nakagawai]|uniref:Uncharacterized protein n=1 Tax=Chryseobacterium nakagawai TaxID=1241982 RepID=A0AAD1DRS3_CHRNA|nr:hypothetical protein [Chryseobacterium nakagawai]AZA91189.1 hypothetical protein EG343_11375 [Chryseobacterium nakagawai]VEH22755.1 Uncharacterised protein [Chryseobacterium nakagawai]
MKKLFLLAAVSTVLLHSCSGEREEEDITPKPESKTLKTEINYNRNLDELNSEVNGGSNPINSIDTLKINGDRDESEIIPPGDVKPPKGN